MLHPSRIQELKHQILATQEKAVTMDDWVDVAKLEIELVALQSLPERILRTAQ